MVLRAENLSKQYDGGFSLKVPHIGLQQGRICAVVGPNGAGKTTLLNVLSLIEPPLTGALFLRGEKVTGANIKAMRKRMNMLMEEPFLFNMSVFENIAAGLRCHGIPKQRWAEVCGESLKKVGMEGYAGRNARQLSRGEAQRAAIARSLALDPEVLFMDEPFTNVDIRNIRLIEGLMQSLRKEGRTTVVFTTHDLFQAYRLSDGVISIVEGRLVHSSIENLFTGDVEEKDGLQSVELEPGIPVEVITGKRGRVHICIPPHDILLSHTAVSSSARNSFRGKVKAIQLQGQTVRVTAAVGAAIELVALITRASCESMRLTVGADVFLVFKSTSVKVF